MNKEKFCPECGTQIESDEQFCQNCGTEIPTSGEDKETSIIGAGARANIMGGVNKTSNTHNNVNTSNVDNSSTVNHNTTYVMNEKKAEYCEVCGNAFEEKHARCPKCGKEICLDCKVKGKNRCIECEKKAINEYRTEFQKLYLATNGDIRFTERQIMNSLANRLDLEDCTEKIEKELTAELKPAVKAVQPEVTPIATAAAFSARTPNVKISQVGAKDFTPVDNTKSVEHKQTGGGSNMKWFIAIIVLAAIIGFFALSGGNENKQNDMEPTAQETQEASVPQSESAPTVKEEPKTVYTEEPASEKNNTVKAAEEKPDANYEAGMKAYEAGEGLEAIGHFSKSGSAKAYYMLGIIYESGCGNVGINDMLARKNFKKAAKLGSAEAQAKL